MDINDFKTDEEITWCPGCGDFGILNALKKSLVEFGRPPKDILIVSGIGQAGKLSHYLNCNGFNGLHGRALPVAAAAKIANRELTVIVVNGDGDCYSEGGNHLIHNIRRNVDITVIVHNNQVYGLTKGQASPTTDPGVMTKIQPEGVILDSFHPIEIAIAAGCGFVARGYAGSVDHLAWLILEGIKYPGFALIDVLQPCITFNKKNTYQWYAQRVYKVNEDPTYNPMDKIVAYQKAMEWDEKIPIGIIYKTDKKTYDERSGLVHRMPLVEEPIDNIDIQSVLNEFSV